MKTKEEYEELFYKYNNLMRYGTLSGAESFMISLQLFDAVKVYNLFTPQYLSKTYPLLLGHLEKVELYA